MNDNIYVSLDEAREELKKRWGDVELRKKIEAELGDKFMPYLLEKPRSVLTRQVCSPDNGAMFFYQCARYVGADPFAWEDYGDMFVSFNEEKKGLGRLRVVLEDGTGATVDIMNFHENEKKKIGDCILKDGSKLTDFHKEISKICYFNIEKHDNAEWGDDIDNAADYYYLMFLHFIAHGVLFESFVFDINEDEKELEFTKRIVLPTIEKIEKKFGLKPIIVRLYPEQQTDEEDLYWWSYPSSVNKYLLDYARNNSIEIKKLSI